MPTSPPPAPPSPLALLLQGADALRRDFPVAWPLALLYGLYSLLLAEIFWPAVDPQVGEKAMAGTVLLQFVFLGAIAAGMVAVGLVWARVVVLGPASAFAGGWPAFFARFKRGVYRALSAGLLVTVLILPALMAGALAGLVVSMVAGSAGGAAQLAMMAAFVSVPILLVGAALWIAVIREALDRPLSIFAAAQAVARRWRPSLLLMLAIAAAAAALYLLLDWLFGSVAGESRLGAALRQLILGTSDMALAMILIAALAAAMPPADRRV